MNRLQDFFDAASNTRTPEAFVQVPHVFFKDLSPEQFRALQQIYGTAFKRAQDQLLNQKDDAMLDGLGI